MIRKFHSECGAPTLTSRALVHMLRRFVEKDEDDKRTLALQERIRTLSARRPSHLTGRQMYLKDLIGMAASWNASGRRVVTAKQYKKIMQHHAGAFARLSTIMKQRYESAAAAARAQRSQDLEENLEHVETQLRLQRERVAEERSKRTPRMLLSQCRFSSEDLHALQKKSSNSHSLQAGPWRTCGRQP